MSNMNKTKLRRAVEKCIKKSLDDITWKEAREAHGERDIDENDSNSAEFGDAVESIANIAKERERYFEARRAMECENEEAARHIQTIRRTRNAESAWRFPKLEEQRCRALMPYYTARGQQTFEVREFRRQFLGDEAAVLNPIQAQAFLTSPANRYLAVSQMEIECVPFVGHHSLVVSENSDMLPAASLEYATPQTIGDLRRQVSVNVDPPGKILIAEDLRLLMVGQHYSQAFPNYIDYVDADGRWASDPVFPGSVLDELRIISKNLSEIQPWMPELIPNFILTGRTPVISPVINSLARKASRIQHSIVLRIAPWTSVETVKRMYLAVQNGTLGHKKRAVSERILSLFKFVQERGEPQPRTGKWNNLMKEWNDSFPHWTYGSVRHFQRDYRERGKRILLNPLSNASHND